MKSRIIAVVVLGAALATVAAFAAGGDNAAGSSELEALKAQVKTLEQRVAVLEKRLGQDHPRSIVPMPSPGRPGRQAPDDDWLPREFNGRRYYIVPIGTEPNKAPVLVK